MGLLASLCDPVTVSVMRRLTLAALALALGLSACGGSSETAEVVTLTTVQWWDTTIPATNIHTGPGGSIPVVNEGDPLEGPAVTTPNQTAPTTTAPLNVQVAFNFAAEIAERLNQKPGPVTTAQVQAAAKTWSAESRGKITLKGFESVTAQADGSGAVVTVMISGKKYVSYVCPGVMAVVAPQACA